MQLDTRKVLDGCYCRNHRNHLTAPAQSKPQSEITVSHLGLKAHFWDSHFKCLQTVFMYNLYKYVYKYVIIYIYMNHISYLHNELHISSVILRSRMLCSLRQWSVLITLKRSDWSDWSGFGQIWFRFRLGFPGFRLAFTRFDRCITAVSAFSKLR